MSAEEKRDWIETFIGGALGVAAIVAAVCEYRLGDGGAMAGMLKDVFGTAVVVVLLLFAVMPKWKPRNLDKLLEREVETWGKQNVPMIFKSTVTKDSKCIQRFSILQNPQKKYTKLILEKENLDIDALAHHPHETGRFLDIPDYAEMIQNEFQVEIIMNQSHFQKIEGIDQTINDLSLAINQICKNVKATTNAGIIKLQCEKIASKYDVYAFVETLNFVLDVVKVIA